LDWRRRQPQEADALYARLRCANDAVVEVLGHLTRAAEQDATGYADCLKRCQRGPMALLELPATETGQLLGTLFTRFQEVRAAFRELSDRAAVPIEPPSQSRLLDACMSVPGVVMAGVPGGGSRVCVGVTVVCISRALGTHY
jgi:phosphomevalonate kinase